MYAPHQGHTDQRIPGDPKGRGKEGVGEVDVRGDARSIYEKPEGQHETPSISAGPRETSAIDARAGGEDDDRDGYLTSRRDRRPEG